MCPHRFSASSASSVNRPASTSSASRRNSTTRRAFNRARTSAYCALNSSNLESPTVHLHQPVRSHPKHAVFLDAPGLTPSPEHVEPVHIPRRGRAEVAEAPRIHDPRHRPEADDQQGEAAGPLASLQRLALPRMHAVEPERVAVARLRLDADGAAIG